MRNVIAILVALSVVALGSFSPAWSQVVVSGTNSGGGVSISIPSGGGAPIVVGGSGFSNDPAEMKKMMEEWKKQSDKQMKDALGMNDEEWAVVGPKIEKVTTTAQESRGHRMRGPQPEDATQTDVQKTFAALQKLLADKESKPEDVKGALTAYREARAKAKTDVEKAQKELKDVLTIKQEAKLVTMGLLE